MAREYSSKRTSRQRGSGSQQILLVVVTFLLGYLTASVFDVETISHWMNTQVLAHQQVQAKPKRAEVQQQQAQIPPKPKFEFYTLLANEKVSGAGQPAAGSVPSHASNAAGRAASTVTAAQRPPVVANTGTRPLPKTAAQQVAQVKPGVAQGKPGAASASKGRYLVQVASFKARSDAEQMKGVLILKGFDVSVVAFSQAQGNNWFRVIVGPYANRNLAQKAQFTLAKNERLRGMVVPVS